MYYAVFRHARKLSRLLMLPAALLCCLALASCGGGGGARTAAMAQGGPGFLPNPGLAPQAANVTKFAPSLNMWHLYSGTKNWYWVSAIGSTAGLSASMSNPCTEMAVAIIPTHSYNNPGTVDFYVDGKKTSSLDLSQAVPFAGYSDQYVSYYTVAKDLPQTMHTVTMVIATGTVAFDGWRILYNQGYMSIDASEINTSEFKILTAANTLRNAIEEYYQSNGRYPNPADGNVTEFLNADTFLNQIPENPLTHKKMVQCATGTFSPGDYRYDFKSQNEYTLIAFNGKGPLVTLTRKTAESEFFKLEVASPTNHFATNTAFMTFTGTLTTKDPAQFSICCGAGGSFATDTTGGPFSYTVFLNEGRNDLKFKLTDGFGNSLDFLWTVTKDTTPPSISLLQPYPLVGTDPNQQATVFSTPAKVQVFVEPDAVVSINGTTVTEDLKTVTVNGQSTTVKDPGVYSLDVPLQPGPNIVAVTAADTLGNSRTQNFTIVLTPVP